MQNALNMMRDAGFEISDEIEVLVDPDLPFMGYSTQRKSGHVIVVAGMALKQGPIDGLLIHEMSHIYRTKQRHPSHNHQLLNSIGLHIIHENQLEQDYEIRTVQEAVNHIQDLYADDISFQVFQKSGSFTQKQAFEFFLDWINDTPIKEKTKKDRWLNISTMLNNSFALSNLTRHNIPDIDNQAQNKTQKFLSQADDTIQKEFSYFKNFMTNLKQNPTEQQFEKDLTAYLDRIVKLAAKKA